jgi:hypothetical protein
MQNFEIGDRVRCVRYDAVAIADESANDILGQEGVVVNTPSHSGTPYVVVETDSVVADTNMWYFLEEELEVISHGSVD